MCSTGSLWPYYSVLSTSVAYSRDWQRLTVGLSVPLLDSANMLHLYRVHNLPVKVRAGYSVTADITTEYLLVGREGEYHLPLAKQDFQDCRVYQVTHCLVISPQSVGRQDPGRSDGQQFYCGFGPLLQSQRSPSCEIQLFNVEGEGAMCQSRLTHGLVQVQTTHHQYDVSINTNMQPFTRLYNGSWVFAALNTQVPVMMNCPNSSIPTSLLGFGVINLLPGCTLSSEVAPISIQI